jgi:hypothetical protein
MVLLVRPTFLLLVLLACSGERREPAEQQQVSKAPPAIATVAAFSITGTAMAGVAVCAPLTRVKSVFTAVRDTVMHGESDEVGWPSRIVVLAPGEELLFETSWVDTVHIWRISTTSPHGHTRSGLHVGSTISEVLATGDSLSFEYPEGILAITLARDSVGFEVDDSAATRFWHKFNYTGDPLQVLDHDARIKALGIGADCRHAKAAA